MWQWIGSGLALGVLSSRMKNVSGGPQKIEYTNPKPRFGILSPHHPDLVPPEVGIKDDHPDHQPLRTTVNRVLIWGQGKETWVLFPNSYYVTFGGKILHLSVHLFPLPICMCLIQLDYKIFLPLCFAQYSV